VHLLATDPAGDGSAVETLLTAAGAALAAGAPEAAEAYLRRALAEPPADADRPELLRMLGRASARAGRLDAAADALKQGLTLVDESVPRARLAIDLAQALRLAGDLAEALKVLEEARERLGDEDRELALWLEAEIAVASHTGLPAADWIGRLAAVVASATGPTPAERSLRALYSYAAAASGKLGAPEVETLARSALPTAPASPAPLILLQTAAAGLAMAGRPGEALAVLDQALDQARRLGDSSQFGFLSLTRTWVALRAGRVHEAEADARAALASCEQGPYNLAYAIGSLVAALIERGELEPAHATLAEHGLAQTRNLGPLPGATLLNARGRLRRLQGRLEDALADLHGCGEMVLCAGLPSPTFMEWRMDSALAHLALDQVEAARRLAAEDLELAHRFGARRELGMALRTMGLVEGGERGLELLRESVAVLDRSEGRLEHARSLVELGAALRRAGHRTAARESLTAGMDLAHRCGADAIVEHAYSELRAAGARPRRAASTGTEALTPSERRVTEMAAERMTNKEIAQALFVTVRTVEMHVTNAYRKLEINSREELPAALDTA
jgi:DNA-binding CsgD family transcriptional regulator